MWMVILFIGTVASAEILELPDHEVMGEPLAAVDFMADVQTGVRRGELGAATLAELLAELPGVATSAFGAAASRPVIRGLDGHRVGVLQSGLGLGDLSASSPDHAVALDPGFVGSLQLFRGAAALRFGGLALGGAIDVEPDFLRIAETLPGAEGRFRVGFDSVNKGRHALMLTGYGTDHWAVRVNQVFRDAGDYRIPGPARTPAYDRNNRLRVPPSARGQVAPNPVGTVPNTDYTTQATGMGLGNRNSPLLWTVGLHRYRSEYGVPLDGHTHGNPFGNAPGFGPSPLDGVRIDLAQSQWSGSLDWRPERSHQARPQSGVRAQLAHTDFAQTETEGAFLINAFSQRQTQLQTEAELYDASGVTRIGWSSTQTRYTNRNLYYIANRIDEDFLATRALLHGVSVVREMQWNHWLFIAAARLDAQQVRRTDRLDLQRSAAVHGIGLDVVYRWNAEWETRLHVSDTRRIPHPEELFIEAPHGATGVFLIPDPDLSHETARLVELSQQIQLPHGSIRLQVYQRNVDNFIFLQNLGFEVEGLTAHAYVQRDAVFRGAELTAASRWLTAARAGQFQASVIGEWMIGNDRARDIPLPRIAPARVGGTLDWRLDAYQARLSVFHSFAQNRVPPGVFGTLAFQTPTPAFTMVDLAVSRSWTVTHHQFHITLVGSNLLNQTVRTHSSFLKDVAPRPGRGVAIEAGWSF